MLLLTVLGGILITISSSLYLYVNGRIAGFSGMLWSVTQQDENKKDKGLFLLSMIITNAFVYTFNNLFNLKENLYDPTSKQTNGVSFIGFVISGLLVGFGTKLGNGCTSGHGVCGLPRLSKRSWVFIVVMMIVAIAAANFKHRFGLFNSTHDITRDGFMTTMTVYLVFMVSCYIFYEKYFLKWNNMTTKEIQQQIVTMISGFLFCLGLILSGFVRREKVYNFLVFSSNWDYSLMIILGVAVGLNLIIFKMILDQGKTYYNEDFKLAKNSDVDKKLVMGAIAFGMGWGISSLCPGPALLLAQFGTFKVSLVFVSSMIGGQVLADKVADFL